MVLISKYMFPKGFVGLTLWPIIILKNGNLKNDEILLNHEKIHLRQQLELLIVPFYIWYFIEWLFGLIKYQSAYKAYKNISFEKEAYKNETNFDYLKKRPRWNFLIYF